MLFGFNFRKRVLWCLTYPLYYSLFCFYFWWRREHWMKSSLKRKASNGLRFFSCKLGKPYYSRTDYFSILLLEWVGVFEPSLSPVLEVLSNLSWVLESCLSRIYSKIGPTHLMSTVKNLGKLPFSFIYLWFLK